MIINKLEKQIKIKNLLKMMKKRAKMIASNNIKFIK